MDIVYAGGKLHIDYTQQHLGRRVQPNILALPIYYLMSLAHNVFDERQFPLYPKKR